MDPNANLRGQARLIAAGEGRSARYKELRIALLEWLSRGGFAPDWGAVPATVANRARPWEPWPGPYEVIDKPLPWQLAGRTWTATGYGAAIPSTRVVRLGIEKRERRVYVTCYSNTGTGWITVNGRKWIIE